MDLHLPLSSSYVICLSTCRLASTFMTYYLPCLTGFQPCMLWTHFCSCIHFLVLSCLTWSICTVIGWWSIDPSVICLHSNWTYFLTSSPTLALSCYILFHALLSSANWFSETKLWLHWFTCGTICQVRSSYTNLSSLIQSVFMLWYLINQVFFLA